MEVEVTIWFWVGFNLFVVALLAIDLGVFHRNAHEVSMREAGIWSVVWVALALLFNAGLYVVWGAGPALEFLTGYLIEKSLSVDNLFVFLIIMASFRVPREDQQKVLLFGIVFALVARTGFIFLGAALINSFSWVFYLFGLVLLVTAGSMLKPETEESHSADNFFIRLAIAPLRVVFDANTKTAVRYEGRVPPMENVSGKLKDLDARVEYTSITPAYR